MKINLKIILLAALFLAAFIVRVYRIDQLLGFYYDQGRDALVIWDLIHGGKFFLIGPTTGIEGIFRGPWYYWLITPFYWIGRGNPVWPSVFLSATTVVATFLMYKITAKLAGLWAGVLAAIISGFSFSFVMASRWLSNPTPMFLISMLFVYSLFLIIDGKKWPWVATAFLAGLAMQFGSAAELFYFLGLLFFIILLFFRDRKKLPSFKIILLSVAALGITALPQVIFDLRHGGILSGTISKFIFGEGSFKLSFWEMAKVRFPFYYDVFFSKLSFGIKTKAVFALLFGGLIVVNLKKIIKDSHLLTILLLLLAPIIGMLFFQGNQGNVYDYYFTGYYLIFVIFFASVIGLVSKTLWGKIIIAVFLVLFLKENLPQVRDYIKSGVDGPSAIALGNQKLALDWINNNAGTQEYNIDVYVPPVIPYAYNYLTKWYLGGKPSENRVPLLYTLYEIDSPHPERLTAWLVRQAGIGKVIDQQSFGGITVQKRTRI